MRIVLKQGDVIQIEVEDGDGIITVGYGTEELYVDADMPDSDSRIGRIYSERFGEDQSPDKAIVAGEVDDDIGYDDDDLDLDGDRFLDKVMEEAAEAELESEEFDQAILEDPVGDDVDEGAIDYDTRPIVRASKVIDDAEWEAAITADRERNEA